MNRRNAISALAIPMMMGLLVAGCEKLTRKNYERLQVGIAHRQDVERTLGDDRHAGFDDLWHYERVDKHLNVLIHFDESGIVTRKEWHDIANGIHDDTALGGSDNARESVIIKRFE